MSDKTEQPTPKRIRDSREKGDICKGQDLAPAAVVLGITVYLIANAFSIYEAAAAMVETGFSVMTLPYEEAAGKCAALVVNTAIGIVAPIVALLMAVALAVLLAQTGFLFAPKAALPKLENLNPKKWFSKVFSMKNLVELLKNIVKVLLLSFIVWRVLENCIPALFAIPRAGIGALWSVLGQALSQMLLQTAGAFAAVAVLDFLYQKYKWTHEHMMSIDEVKREFKDSEGDPLIKSQRKQLQRELMEINALDGVRKAKVLVVNPTHYAVALDYDKEKTPLPVILAKGEGSLALRMIEVAKQEGIPVMRNVPLARALYSEGTENAYIPRDLIGPVAEVIRWVQSLKNPAG